MRFLYIRHGQSTNNLLWAETGADEGRSIDPRLTPTGVAQAAALATYAAQTGLPWAPTHLYASAMLRAVETATPLAEALDLPLHLHPEIYEVGGIYDRDADGVNRAHPGAGSEALTALTSRVVLPEWARTDGWFDAEHETERAQIMARADRVIASLEATHGDDDVVALVSHGWFGNVLLSRLLGITEQAGAVEISNTAMVLVEDTGPEVPWHRTAVRINWMPHLTDDLITDSALHP